MDALVHVESMSPTQLAKRAKILDAVLELVDAEGGARVSVKDVAAASGIALGTIYRFFGSKEHMFAAAVVYWGAPFSRAMTMEPNHDIAAHLVNSIQRGTRAYQRHPNVLALMINAATSPEPFVAEIMAELRISTRQGLLAGMRSLPSEQAFVLSELVQALWWDLLVQWHTGRRSIPDGLMLIEQNVRWTIEGLQAAIVPDASLR